MAHSGPEGFLVRSNLRLDQVVDRLDMLSGFGTSFLYLDIPKPIWFAKCAPVETTPMNIEMNETKLMNNTTKDD